MTSAPRIRVVSAEAFRRETPFRFPFRFGIAEVRHAPQAFVRIAIEDASGRRATGWSAEMMVPKWFDKNPDLSPQDNLSQLRTSLGLAMARALAVPVGTAFDLHHAMEADHHAQCAGRGLGGLIASFGLALVDRAIIDALGRLEGKGAADLVTSNTLGIDSRTAPDLDGFDLAGFLGSLVVPSEMAIRHTVGLGDALVADDLGERLNDGLPETLQEVIAAYGHRHFKLKIAGDPKADCARLARIAKVIEQFCEGYRVTLDGNEQYRDEEQVLELMSLMAAEPALAVLNRRILFLEQPIARAYALSRPIRKLASFVPVEIDESDADMDAFVAARELGYTGISSKSCKGFYRSVLNAARVAKWNAEEDAPRYFLSGEDLTTQSGVSVQQDLLLAGLVGVTHVERNGHHFVDGMAGAPDAEQQAFLSAHPDIYARRLGRTRLDIAQGRLPLGSIASTSGLGVAVEPLWTDMKPLGED